jgi:hypothetical protein
MGTWFEPLVDFEIIFDPEGVIRDVEIPFFNPALQELIKDTIYAEMRLTYIEVTKVIEEDVETIVYGRAKKVWQMMRNNEGTYNLDFDNLFKVHLTGSGNKKKAVACEKGYQDIHNWVEKTINKNAITFIFNPNPQKLGPQFIWEEAT